MSYETEQKRRHDNDPVIKRIPMRVWKTVFYYQLSSEQRALMTCQPNELPRVIEQEKRFLRRSSQDRICFWFCCALRTPAPKDIKLISLAKKLGLSVDEQLSAAAAIGYLTLIEKLLNIPGVDVSAMISAKDYDAFCNAAEGDHLNVMEKLLNIPGVDVSAMISAKDYKAFTDVASGGHLNMMEKLLNMPGVDTSDMINRRGGQALSCASVRGHLMVVEALLNRPPVDVSIMVSKNKYAAVNAFVLAAHEGNTTIIDKLLNISSINDDPIVAQMRNSGAFSEAVRNGHLNVIEKLLNMPNFDVSIMYTDQILNDISLAVEDDYEKNRDMIIKLYSFPGIFSLIESIMHDDDWDFYYGTNLTNFLSQKFDALRRRADSGHPTVVLTQQEAHLCCHILRYLKRLHPSTPEVLANINFLINIPIIQSLLPPPCSSEGQELGPLTAALSAPSNVSVNESRTSKPIPSVAQITYADLPNDTNGLLLVELERRLVVSAHASSLGMFADRPTPVAPPHLPQLCENTGR